jgi:hypothetical protein
MFLADSGREFSNFAETLIRGFHDVIDERYPALPSSGRAQYLRLIEGTLYIVLVDTVSVDHFWTLAWVYPTVNRLMKNLGALFEDRCARAEEELVPAVRHGARDLLEQAMACCPFSKMFHFALKAASLVSSVAESDDAAVNGVAWALKRARCAGRVLQYLVLWGFFVRCFFPRQNHLRDSIGACDVALWRHFARLFDEIEKLPSYKF